MHRVDQPDSLAPWPFRFRNPQGPIPSLTPNSRQQAPSYCLLPGSRGPMRFLISLLSDMTTQSAIVPTRPPGSRWAVPLRRVLPARHVRRRTTRVPCRFWFHGPSALTPELSCARCPSRSGPSALPLSAGQTRRGGPHTVRPARLPLRPIDARARPRRAPALLY